MQTDPLSLLLFIAFIPKILASPIDPRPQLAELDLPQSFILLKSHLPPRDFDIDTAQSEGNFADYNWGSTGTLGVLAKAKPNSKKKQEHCLFGTHLCI